MSLSVGKLKSDTLTGPPVSHGSDYRPFPTPLHRSSRVFSPTVEKGSSGEGIGIRELFLPTGQFKARTEQTLFLVAVWSDSTGMPKSGFRNIVVSLIEAW